jgi:arsenate reductase
MAEGLLNAYYSGNYKAYSAGIEPGNINPYVVQVMAEIGIDLSKHRAKSIEEFREKSFDIVVTVCDHAQEVCPFFPGEQILHKNFQDPSQIQGSEKEILEGIRLIRDEIRDWIRKTF